MNSYCNAQTFRIHDEDEMSVKRSIGTVIPHSEILTTLVNSDPNKREDHGQIHRTGSDIRRWNCRVSNFHFTIVSIFTVFYIFRKAE